MLDVFSSFSTLNCIYFFMLMAGIIWTAVVLIGGAVSSVDLPDIDFGAVDASGIDFSIDHDVGFDHGSVEVSALSPITIASFVTSFGGLGLIATQLLGIPEPPSLFFAAVGATLIAGGMFVHMDGYVVPHPNDSLVGIAYFQFGRQMQTVGIIHVRQQ